MDKVAVYISCPACADDGYYTYKTYWQHAYCGVGTIYLTSRANIYCSGCGHESHISNWGFKCPEGRHDFRVPSTNGFIQVLTVSSQIVNEAGQKWLISVLQWLN